LKESKFTTEPIVFALRQAEAGLGVEATCRELGIRQETPFRVHTSGIDTPPVSCRLRRRRQARARMSYGTW
jgi:hypothetical protein